MNQKGFTRVGIVGNVGNRTCVKTLVFKGKHHSAHNAHDATQKQHRNRSRVVRETNLFFGAIVGIVGNSTQFDIQHRMASPWHRVRNCKGSGHVAYGGNRSQRHAHDAAGTGNVFTS